MIKRSRIAEELESVFDALPSRKRGAGDFLRRTYAEWPEYREQPTFNGRACKAEMDDGSPVQHIRCNKQGHRSGEVVTYLAASN